MVPTRRLVAFALICATPTAASALPPNLLGFQGRLLRADGSAATGIATVAFSVWDAGADGSQLWTEQQTLGLSDGYYSTFLGLVTAPPDSLFTGGARWLEVRVGGETLSPRQQLGVVPWASVARTALAVSGSADVTSLRVGGQTVVDSAGRLSGSARYSAGAGVLVDDASQTISLAACGDGQVLLRDTSSWRCAPAVTRVTAGAPLSVANGSSTPQLSIAQAGASSGGFLSSSDWSLFNAKLDGTSASGGDLAGTFQSPRVVKLQSRAVSSNTPVDGQVLKWSAGAAQWEPAPDATTPVVARAPLTAEGASAAGYVLSMEPADASRDGYLASFDWARFDGKFDAATECTGDLSGLLPGPRVKGLQSRPVSDAAPGYGQVLFWNGTQWAPTALAASDVTGLPDGFLSLEGSQTVDGAKRFTTPPTFDTPLPTSSGGTGAAGFTPGGVVFAGAGGALAEDKARLSWDAAGGRLGVGTSSPSSTLDVSGAGTVNAGGGLLTGGVLRIDASGALQPGVSASTDILASGTLPTSRGGTGMTAFSSGGIVFGASDGTLAQDGGALAWDGTNKRLGLGTTSPASTLHVSGGALTLDLGQSLSFTNGVAVKGTDNNLQLITNNTVMLESVSNSYVSINRELTLPAAGVNIASANARLSFNGTSPVLYGYNGLVLNNDAYYSAPTSFQVAGAPKMTLDYTGKLGIGTTGPAAKLDVYGGEVTSAAGLARVTQDAATNYPTLVVKQNGGGGNGNMDQGLVVDVAGTNGGTGNALNVYGQATSRFVVKNGGTIGIGTTTPAGVLDINGGASGNVILSSYGDTNANSPKLSFWGDPTGRTAVGPSLQGVSSGGNGRHDLVFFQHDANDYTTSAEAMRIRANGNVGIGTTAPSYRLDVNGTMKVAGTSSTPGITLVSKEGYKESWLLTQGKFSFAFGTRDFYGMMIIRAYGTN